MAEHLRDEVTVSIDEIIERNLEEFLDLLDTLCRAGNEDAAPLSDISWEVVSVGTEPNTIVIAVTGSRETLTGDPNAFA